MSNGKFNKRAHKTLILVKKCEILDLLDKGKSLRWFETEFGVNKSTVFDIKKKRDAIRKFATKCEQKPEKRQTMKLGEHADMEEALMTWFIQQRHQHIPISTEMIQTKAKYFYNQITGQNDFTASLGWIEKFKARHGIRKLKICGEKVSSDVSAVEPFRQKLKNIIEEMELDNEQIYNADESAAFWKVIPTTTMVHSHEKSASGRKISKDRITFMPCCNASGTHKLPLLVIGKSVNPRSFKNFDLPVIYNASKKGWMSTYLFTEWYRKHFIPNVKKFLKDNNRPLKAILLVDNAPCHVGSEDLGTDPNFRIVFLPPNCTAVIQPLDQDLIQNIKVTYRKQLLNHLITDNTDLGIALKKLYAAKCCYIFKQCVVRYITTKYCTQLEGVVGESQRRMDRGRFDTSGSTYSQ